LNMFGMKMSAGLCPGTSPNSFKISTSLFIRQVYRNFGGTFAV
jgi:hypothetical protein